MSGSWNNPNPRIGQLLKHTNASEGLTAALSRFGMKGVKWLLQEWPEERRRRELPGWGPQLGIEWHWILDERGLIREHERACEGCGKVAWCLPVQLRVPRSMKFVSGATFLCSECRERTRGDWRYARRV